MSNPARLLQSEEFTIDNSASIAKKFVDLLGICFPGEDLKRYRDFWFRTFQLMETEGFFRPDGIKERTKHLIDGSIRFFEDIRDANLTDDAVTERLRGRLIESSILCPSPSIYGCTESDLFDAESAIGFYRFLSPYPQSASAFSIFAPCMANMVQRIFDGPTMCWLSSWLVFHKTITTDQLKQLEAVAGKMHRRFLKSVSKEKRQQVAAQLYKLVNKLKSLNPFFPMLNSQIFYEEGIRFYQQGARNYYVSSTTSGLLVPEEFYGRDYYYPGITNDFPPELFSRDNYLRYDELEKLHSWDYHLKEIALKVFSHSRKETKNPYRSRYFIDGIRNTSLDLGKHIHYQYSVTGVAKSLQNSYRTLGDSHKQALFIEDVRNLYTLFYKLHCDNSLTLYENPSFRVESNWITLATDSRGFSLLSMRGKEEERIAHGWKMNIGAIESIGLMAHVGLLLLNLSRVSDIAVDTAFGASIVTEEIVARWVKERYHRNRVEFVDARVLPKWKSTHRRSTYVEQSIDRFIGLDRH